MNRSFDVAIIGLGAMGSAAAFHLACRKQRVLGLDRFTPPHPLGSSHGESRIIREAYFEHPLYVPLVQRAYQLWDELERSTPERLWVQTGGLMIGHPDGTLVSGSQRSAQTHRLPYELLSAHEIRERFPVFAVDDETAAVWDTRAGILFPEKCIQAHLNMAQEHGAQLHFEEPVLAWEADTDAVSITTAQARYRAHQLLLTAGAWVTRLLPDLVLPLTVARQVLFWFEPRTRAELFDPDLCPIYIWEYEPNRAFYGFPNLGHGVKIAHHHEGELADPESLQRAVPLTEVETIRGLVDRYMPDANGPLRSAAVCMYTNTPDSHFLIDVHPAHPNVLVASPCSGHGFKFAAAIGEILADLLTDGHARFDLTPFRFARFS